MSKANAKPDSERRLRQSMRILDIIQVHRMSNGGRDVKLKQMAAKLECSERTVRRHLKTLELVYESIGTCLLDG